MGAHGGLPWSQESSRRPFSKKKKLNLCTTPHTDNRRMFAYLRKRGIASQVIQGFLSAGLLHEDAIHHNCVFLGRDSSGAAVFAIQRGTYDRDGANYKGDIPGSDKHIAFRLPCRPGQDWVLVFEAPIDLMSYCTLHRTVTSNAITLCGIYDKPLETYLEDYPHLRRILLCLDSDMPGREAIEKLSQKYKARGYTVKTALPLRGKDWNESLCQRIRQWERRR